MDENTLFRSAINGFKREDVMDYITKTARQNEAAVSALKAELEEARGQLDSASDALHSAQEELAAVTAQRDAIQARADAAGILEEQLTDALGRIAELESRLEKEKQAHAADRAGAEARQAEALKEQQSAHEAALAEAKQAYEAELAGYREDAAGYEALAQQVGRVMLHAEVSGEMLLARSREEAQAMTQAAEEQSAKAVEDAQAQSEALLTEAHSKVAEARGELMAVQGRAEELFRKTQAQFSSTQDSVNLSVRRVMDQLEEMRSLLLEMTDGFNSAEASFEPPALEPEAEAEYAAVGDGE